MLEPAVLTFLAAAECGSFTQAAARLYLSPTAVKKQIDALERQLGVALFERGAHGVRLTPAGQSLAQDARQLQEQACRAVARARAAGEACRRVFCVGTSLLNPAKPFMDLWERVGGQFAGYKLHLVPFADDSRGVLAEVGQLGQRFDFLVAACESQLWLGRCQMLPLGRCRMMVAVRRGHPLAARQSLRVEDLHGYTLMMVAEGDAAENDALRRMLVAEHPQIRIEDTPHFYDLSVFNRCAETDNVLLTLDCWQEVHPALVTLPVAWDRGIPCGLLYARTPDADVQRFVQAVKETLP